VKHFHIYDTCGEVMCVDADDWHLPSPDTPLYFILGKWGDKDADTVATFNWSNVVCVREEEDDDEGETAGIPPVFSGALN
jgi:hypothetical protein